MKYYQLLEVTFKEKYKYIFPVIFNLKEPTNFEPFNKIYKILEKNGTKPEKKLDIKKLNKIKIEEYLSQYEHLDKAVISITFSKVEEQGASIIEHVYNRQIRNLAVNHNETGFGINAGKDYDLIVNLIDFDRI